jgi:phosphatidylglycerophosphate synthase
VEPFAKDTDGFLARHFDRRVSGAISRQLIRTAVTPNQITVFVTLLGLGAGWLMARTGYAPKVLGSLVFLLTSILDGCDGEVARAKNMSSRLGGWLDFWGDNVVHVAVFWGLGVGLQKDTGKAVYRTLGGVLVLGTLVAVAMVSYQTYRAGGSAFVSVVGDARRVQTSPWKRRLTALSDALARRDFVYGLVIFALLGWLDWALWVLAIGTSLYASVLLLLLAVTRR